MLLTLASKKISWLNSNGTDDSPLHPSKKKKKKRDEGSQINWNPQREQFLFRPITKCNAVHKSDCLLSLSRGEKFIQREKREFSGLYDTPFYFPTDPCLSLPLISIQKSRFLRPLLSKLVASSRFTLSPLPSLSTIPTVSVGKYWIGKGEEDRPHFLDISSRNCSRMGTRRTKEIRLYDLISVWIFGCVEIDDKGAIGSSIDKETQG